MEEICARLESSDGLGNGWCQSTLPTVPSSIARFLDTTLCEKHSPMQFTESFGTGGIPPVRWMSFSWQHPSQKQKRFGQGGKQKHSVLVFTFIFFHRFKVLSLTISFIQSHYIFLTWTAWPLAGFLLLWSIFSLIFLPPAPLVDGTSYSTLLVTAEGVPPTPTPR